MAYGLSYSEIDTILKEAISPEKPVDSEVLRDVICKAITKNNNKLQKDLQKEVERLFKK